MNVLHVLDHSLPYITDYSLRSRYIIKLQKDLGIKPLVITSPHHEINSSPIELIEGVFHYRTPLPANNPGSHSRCPFINEKLLIPALGKIINHVTTIAKIRPPSSKYLLKKNPISKVMRSTRFLAVSSAI